LSPGIPLGRGREQSKRAGKKIESGAIGFRLKGPSGYSQELRKKKNLNSISINQ
jgi:hypothetical protein